MGFFLCDTENNISKFQATPHDSPPPGWLSLQVPEGISPGNCKVVDGVLVAMAEGEKLSSNPFWANLRAERTARITATDWRMLSDYPGADAAAWATYRQALRDVPQNTADPESPSWPSEP